MIRHSRTVSALVAGAVIVLVLIGAFGISRMHLDWLIQGWGWEVSNECEILIGAVLCAGALISAAVLIGAVLIARALAPAAVRPDPFTDSTAENSDHDEGDAAV